MEKPKLCTLNHLQSMIKDMQSLHDTDYILVTKLINYLNYIYCQYIHLNAINNNTLKLVDGVMAMQFTVLSLDAKNLAPSTDIESCLFREMVVTLTCQTFPAFHFI